jgi:hypothetical protein
MPARGVRSSRQDEEDLKPRAALRALRSSRWAVRKLLGNSRIESNVKPRFSSGRPPSRNALPPRGARIGVCPISSILTAVVRLDATWTRDRAALESSPTGGGKLCAMRKRNAPEPFKPRREPTWVVVRDRLSRVVQSAPLEPYADLKAALTAARSARIADGWNCEAIGRSAAFFFCTREGVRHLVSIEARTPPEKGKRW